MIYFISEKKDNQLIKLTGDRFKELINTSLTLKKELSESIYDIEGMYGKGGVAREALLLYVYSQNNLKFNVNVRDRDFLYTGNKNLYEILNKDYLKYLGVNASDDIDRASLSEYFKTRDITLNEVAVNSNELIFTRAAYNDAYKQIIQPSKFSKKGVEVSGRLYSRMILFAVRYNYHLSNKIIPKAIDNFNMLVCLIKAFQLKIESAFFIEAYRLGVIDEEVDNVEQWFLNLYLKNPSINIKDMPEKYINSYDIKQLIHKISSLVKEKGITPDEFITNRFMNELNNTEIDIIKKYIDYFHK